MLTVEIRAAEKEVAGTAEVEIYCDAEGLSLLTRQIEDLKKGATHVHLMTESWAGTELDEKPMGANTLLVHHLRITMIGPKEQA